MAGPSPFSTDFRPPLELGRCPVGRGDFTSARSRIKQNTPSHTAIRLFRQSCTNMYHLLQSLVTLIPYLFCLAQKGGYGTNCASFSVLYPSWMPRWGPNVDVWQARWARGAGCTCQPWELGWIVHRPLDVPPRRWPRASQNITPPAWLESNVTRAKSSNSVDGLPGKESFSKDWHQKCHCHLLSLVHEKTHLEFRIIPHIHIYTSIFNIYIYIYLI